MKDLGISYPTIVRKSPLEDESIVDPNTEAAEGGAAADGSPAKTINVKHFDFVVQFCWQPKTPPERRKAIKEREAAEKAKKAAQAANNTGQQ